MPEDAEKLKQAVDESREHLKPWMPWAHTEPECLPTHQQRLREFRGRFDLDQEYVYGIWNLDESKVLGSSGLHKRVGPDALEIGYWIHKDHVRQGLATEAAKALTKAAFEINSVKRVEIHCQPENLASAAIPKKIAYQFEGILKQRVEFNERQVDSMIWSMFSDQYELSACKNLPIKAFDSAGCQIL